MTLLRMPEWQRMTDRYFWLTAYVIARNSIVREYQSSYLGVVWTVIIPLIQVIIFAIIMPLIMRHPVDNYPLYLVASFSLWAFISGALVQSCNSIINQAETIKRCMVSSVVFVIADVMKQFYNYLISFFVMYGFCLLFYTSPDPVLFLLPLLLLPVFVSILAMAIAVAYVAPYLRDLGYLVQLSMNIMFWFTPVVYPIQAVPESYHWMYWLNPFYILLHPVQQLVLNHQLPSESDMMGLVIVTAISVVTSLFLYRAFRRNYVYYL